jgi:hypothetical protein
MKTSISALFFCLLIITTAIGQNVYKAELVGQIQHGKEAGKIGWLDNIAKLGFEPLAMTIGDTELYICDVFNNRINIYGLDLKYLSQIEMKNLTYETNICSAKKLKIDDGNIIGAGHGIGLVKINNKGQLLYSFRTNQISENVWSTNIFFPYQDKIIFYDGSEKNEKIKFIDKDGKIQEDNNLADQIESDNTASMKELFKTFAAGNDENTTKLHNFLHNKKLVLYNERLLTGRLSDLREYYNLLKAMSKNKVADKVISRSSETIDFIGYIFIDFDSDGNSYWLKPTVQQNILVFSKYGEMLDNFTTDKLIISKAIAPNGDIYFFRGGPELDENVFRIYKISRRW